MEKRSLGHSGLSIAPLVLGGNVFGWTADQTTSFKILDAFVDEGLTMIDTANMYSAWIPGHQGGESEEIIGNWIQAHGKRNQVLIATKVGMQMGDGSQGLKKDYILKSVEDSLKRLKTDVIDLYQSHQDDSETPLEETLEAYALLLKQGKVRAVGASNFSAARLAEAIALGKSQGLPVYSTMQPEYNLYDRQGYEADLESVCMKENLGVISYFSLASGFLTGKYRNQNDLNKSARGGGIGAKYLNPRGLRIISALDKVAEQYKTTAGVIALAWIMHSKSVTAPIASATSVDQLKEIAQATRLKLTPEALSLLSGASAPE